MVFAVFLLTVLGVWGLPPLPVLLALLFFSLAGIPVVNANATAVAMAACGENAGSASSLIGGIQFGFAGIVSALTGALHNDTAYPMAGLIFLCWAVAFAGLRVFAVRKR